MTTNSKQAYFSSKTRRFADSKAGCFFLHFLELQISMTLGALVCYLVVRLISVSSGFATIYRPGTFLFAAGDIFFLTGPVAAWMVFRGHSSRHSLDAGLQDFPLRLNKRSWLWRHGPLVGQFRRGNGVPA